MQDFDTTHDVRVITDGGELSHYEEHHGDEQAAWDAFTEAITQLADGEIAQLIVDDLIAAEHNPEFHGTEVLNPGDYV